MSRGGYPHSGLMTSCPCSAIFRRSPVQAARSDREFPQFDLGDLQLREDDPPELFLLRRKFHEFLYFPDLLFEDSVLSSEQAFLHSGNVQLDARPDGFIDFRAGIPGRKMVQMTFKGRIFIHLSDQIMPADGLEYVVGVLVFQDLPVCAPDAEIEPVEVLHHILEVIIIH